MALTILDPETEGLAVALAEMTGETPAEAVSEALKDRLARVREARTRPRLADELDEIALRCAARPVLDPRSAEEILGYGEDGLPH